MPNIEEAAIPTVKSRQKVKTAIEQSIPTRFRQQVRKNPQQIAIEYRGVSVSYQQLNRRANRIAHAILASSTGKAPVALLVRDPIACLVALIATLKAGRAYIPLDTSSPAARNLAILRSSHSSLLLYEQQCSAKADPLQEVGIPLIAIEQAQEEFPDSDPQVDIVPDDLCYILYTSGSTGSPKGVMQSHRNVLHYVEKYSWAMQICAEDRLTLFHSFCYGSSASHIFCSLLNGATLLPFDIGEQGVLRLAEWLDEERITVYHSVPTVFASLADALAEGQNFPHLRLIRLGGEVVTVRHAKAYHKFFAQYAVLVNSYSATELNGICLYFINGDTPPEDNWIPIGFPTLDAEVQLWGEHGAPVAAGQSGEIVVRSKYLSPGYWHEPELTKAAFAQDPQDTSCRLYKTGDIGRRGDDGALYYLGRKDFRIKLRGHTIEPMEIESVLCQYDGVKEAIVTLSDGVSLTAYVTIHRNVAASDLRSFLAARLPAQMIPCTFEFLDSLPLTANAKVDRKALQKRESAAVVVVVPNTAEEKLLQELWAKILKVPAPATDANFFQLGGHSLLGLRLLHEIERKMGKKLTMAALVQAPTIAQLAALLQSSQEIALAPVPVRNSGTKPPLFCVPPSARTPLSFLRLGKHLDDDRPVYALDYMENGISCNSVEATASACIQMMRTVQPRGPYYLLGSCFGGIIALEMAQQLLQQREEVACLTILDAFLPGCRFGKAPLKYRLRKKQMFWKQLATRLLYRFHPKGREVVRVWTLNRQARRSYTAQFYPGKVHLFVSEERSYTNLRELWQELTAQLAYEVIPGSTHGSITKNHVDVLAKKLQQFMKG